MHVDMKIYNTISNIQYAYIYDKHSIQTNSIFPHTIHIHRQYTYTIQYKKMVKLVEASSIDGQLFPFTREWDSLVRKNWNTYQQLIDRQTYQLQRLQRYFLSLSFPRGYDYDINTLALLKKKQRVGEVRKDQVEIYASIDPDVRHHFNKTFGSGTALPKMGLAVGGGLFLYASYFNFSVPTRLALLAVPLGLDLLWSMRSPQSQIRSSEFLDWVFEYRKARSFNERHQDLFKSAQTRKVIGDNNLVQLGEQLVKLASKE